MTVKPEQLFNKGTVYSSVGLADVLLIVFIVLKLLKVIDWDWWIVLSPFWGQYALAVLVLVIIMISKFILKILK